jgi:predicted aspartyl protease
VKGRLARIHRLGPLAFGVAVAVLLSASALAARADAISNHPKAPALPEGFLPSTAEGCEEGTTVDGVTTIPIKVDKVRDAVDPFINVCFDGQGPYPMVLDTGAASSVISTELAEELGLEKVGPPGRLAGAGCTTKSQTFKLPSWSVGGVELEGGEIATLESPVKGMGNPRGSLGADVLSRFGAARIDFKRETLTLVGKEGARFHLLRNAAPTPKPLLDGKPRLSVPMRVDAAVGAGDGVDQTVEVKVAGADPSPWLIDTGTSFSLIDSGVVKQAKLRPTGTAQRAITYCSTVTVPEYTATALELATGKLKPQIVGSFQGFANGGGDGIFGSDGILGSYSLWQYGSVVIDWAGRRLILGTG